MLYRDDEIQDEEIQSLDFMFDEQIVRFDDLQDDDPDEKNWWSGAWRES